MKKLLFFALLLALVAGCAVTDYPVITDTRGAFTGIIRTGHKAYIVPTSSVATIYPDGSDELFSMVSQNQYGDQKIYTFDNFDPTAVGNLLDQTYCDWRYDGCELARATNNNNPADVVDDYEFFPDCAGARSLSMLYQPVSRIGECGDKGFWGDKQKFMGEFANLATTTWRGGTSYIIPIDSSNTSVSLTTNRTTEAVPLFGSFNMFINDKFQIMVPVTPNARHELRWLSSFVEQNGAKVNASVDYNSLSTSFQVTLAGDGLNYNLNRF